MPEMEETVRMENQELLEMEKNACKVRLYTVEGVFNAKSGHPGGSLSAADIITYLYFKEMRVTPGVDMSSGSLGQGVSAACGMALAAKYDGKDYRVYAMLGDGECEEGQVWEAAMFASHYKLDNLCLIVDYNGLQIDGHVEDVAGLKELDRKFEAFGFEVMNIDGHNFDEIETALNKAKTVKGKPCAIIAKTIKGKGVSFMENQVGWHGKAPNADEYKIAMDELNAQLKALEA